jgi:hypothetical protein
VAKRSARIEGAGRPPVGAGAPSEFDPDYTYVRADLRRIAVLAGAFLALLLILALLLN